MGENKDFLKLIENFDKKCHIPDLECEVFHSSSRIESIKRSRMSYIDTWQRYMDLYNRYKDIACKYSSGKIGVDQLSEELEDIYMSLYRLLKNYSSYEFSFDESTHHIVVHDDHATSIKDIQFNSLETKITELTDQIYHMIYEKDGAVNRGRCRKNGSGDFYAFFDDYVNPEVPIANGGCNSHMTCRIIEIGDKADLNHAPEWFFDTPTYTEHRFRMDHIPDRSVAVSKQYIQLRCPVCGKPMTWDASISGNHLRPNRMIRTNIGSPVYKNWDYPEYKCVNCNSIITYGYRDIQPAYKERTPYYEEGNRDILDQIRERFHLNDEPDRDNGNCKGFLGLRKVLWWIFSFLFCGPLFIIGCILGKDYHSDKFYAIVLGIFGQGAACASAIFIAQSIVHANEFGSAEIFFLGIAGLLTSLFFTTLSFCISKSNLNEEYHEKFDELSK